MTTQSRMAVLPRRYVKGWLWSARLPLRPVERLAALAAGNGPAPLSMALDRAEAVVKGSLGALLRDDVLLAEAQLSRAAVDERREAWCLESEAEAARRKADEHYLDRRQQADDRRHRAEEQAEARRAQADERAEQKTRRIEKKAAEEEKAIRQAQRADEEALERQRRSAELAQAATDRRALAEERAAVAAAEKADAVDRSLEATKERRRTG